MPLITTNVATMLFDFADYDVKGPNARQKFYRVRPALTRSKPHSPKPRSRH
jgi:hypothetical protein